MCVASSRAPSILVLTHSGRLTAYIRTAPSHPKTSFLLLLSDGSLASKGRREKREKPGNKDCSVLVIIFNMAGVLLSELDLAHFSSICIHAVTVWFISSLLPVCCEEFWDGFWRAGG